ncbi:MAG TPA: DUF4011 domain-containing protein, partial [Thermomicrobiales bacterium]|nr:DUF4011 domain-containing protein [Thermomicrobiales bacterium]
MATIEQKLKEWQRELLDFSNRNRLINFRTTVKTPRTLKLVGPTSNELYEHLLTSVRPLLLIPQPEPPEIDPLPTDDEQPEADSFEIEEPASIPIAELDTSAGIDEARTQLSKKRTNTVALRLLKQSRASQLEQSVNILFASFGLLRWRESRPGSRRDSGDFQTSPLFLVPIVIEESPVHDSYKVVSTGEDPELNLSLVER